MDDQNLIPDDDFREMFVDLVYLVLAIVILLAMLCAFLFALDALC